ncbi:MAG TPA: FAD-dependent oxidoreductase, partial [Vineibacter sp.]|nr:FAD-dependent oxidoreductase [Vineibacter sp.]
MTTRQAFDICVIGAGSAGLSLAAGAAQLGLKVALIERDKLGGDCLYYGCVPSKSLIAAAHAAQGVRQAGRFGVHAGEPTIDFAAT